jgi:hypothetical protein
MKTETKLRLRKWALMTLRAIVWRVDEWLHAQEVKYRKDLHVPGGRVTPLQTAIARKRPTATDETAREKPPVRGESFEAWEARRSGIAVVSKKSVRRRGMPVREFDLRFAR